MNQLNYASLEASKLLEEAGIDLKSDKWWYRQDFKGTWNYTLADTSGTHGIPAPSMAEVWRALPVGAQLTRGLEVNGCWTCWPRSLGSPEYLNTNPTDALIDLLIWVRKEAADG